MTDPSSKVKTGLYFVSAWVDGLLIGGLSIGLFAFLKAFPAWSAAHLNAAMALGGLLVWVGNWPHFSATHHRLYGSLERARQFPLTAFFIPALIAMASVAAFRSPDTIAPAFVKLYLLWSPYHFSGQTFGITLLYSRRAGLAFSRWERATLWLFVFGSYLAQSAASETGYMPQRFNGMEIPVFGLPPWIPGSLRHGMHAAGAAFLGLMALRSFRSWRLERKTVPWIALLPSLAQYVWFVSGSRETTFQVFVPLLHSMQYLLIAFSLSLKESPAESSVATRTFNWWFLNIAGGMAMFFGLPRLFIPLGFTLEFSSAVALSAVQIHHFFVDGVIWKLRAALPAFPSARPRGRAA